MLRTPAPRRRRLTTKQRRAIFERDGYRCHLCGRETQPEGPRLRRPEVDHIRPFVKGGTEDLLNLATACTSCNRIKHAFNAEDIRPRLLSCRAEPEFGSIGLGKMEARSQAQLGSTTTREGKVNPVKEVLQTSQRRWRIPIHAGAHRKLVQIASATNLPMITVADFLISSLDSDEVARRLRKDGVRNICRGRSKKQFHPTENPSSVERPSSAGSDRSS